MKSRGLNVRLGWLLATAGRVEIDPGKVLAALCELEDSRKRRGVRNPFAHLLVIMVGAVLQVRHRRWRWLNDP